jgi:hypothetical protein
MIRFTYRHQRQDSACGSAPPNSSPTDAPEAAIALKMPNALGRSGNPANVTVKSPSADGASKAPNTPCSARAATSIVNDCVSPPIADAIAKPARPAMNVHLRPNRSPSFPPNRSRLPNASAYAVMIHWRLSVEKPSARCADGSAICTIVTSRVTISCATPTSASTFQRLHVGLASGPVCSRVPVPCLLI